MNSLSYFVGSKDGREDPVKFVEDVKTHVNSDEYPTIAKAEQTLRSHFQTHLKEKALEWYRDLLTDTRSNWSELKAKFVSEYKIVPRQERDLNRYFNLVYNLKQRGRNIVTYVDEAEKLYKACPANLMAFLPHQFVAGLDNESKINIVQLYLNGKEPITFPEAKKAVVKSYQQIGQPSPFDAYDEPANPVQSTALQAEVNAGLLAFFNELRVQNQSQKLKPVSQYHAPPSTKANSSLPPVPNQNFPSPSQEIDNMFHKENNSLKE